MIPGIAKGGRLQNARILIVDDQEDHIRQLQQMLEAAGYWNISSVVDPRHFLSVYMDFHPDLFGVDTNFRNGDSDPAEACQN